MKLIPAFEKALRAYDKTSRVRLNTEAKRNAITCPLYHYTDREGLKGIITAQQFWFTHYQHLNDDSEIKFGMSILKSTLAEFGRSTRKLNLFFDWVIYLFSAQNMDTAFGFYIASFSRSRDDLHQWERYGQNGKGFAIGLAPKLFAIEEPKPNCKPHEHVFVSSVRYGDEAAKELPRRAIESVARIVTDTVRRKAKTMTHIDMGKSFFDAMAKALIATELVYYSLIVKRKDWEPEREVRLFILGEHNNLSPYLSTRYRGEEEVPFIKHNMPLQTAGSITEVIVGPNAPSDAEDFVCLLLAPFHSDPRSIIRRSTISCGADC